MNLQEYHDNIWLPFSRQLDRKIQNYKILRVLKKCFDVHFSILGLLGICATPKGDVDCYIYIFKRYNPHKYQHLNWQQRWRFFKTLCKQIKEA